MAVRSGRPRGLWFLRSSEEVLQAAYDDALRFLEAFGRNRERDHIATDDTLLEAFGEECERLVRVRLDDPADDPAYFRVEDHEQVSRGGVAFYLLQYLRQLLDARACLYE